MANKEITCICCPLGCTLIINREGDEIQVTGNKCPRGKKYAIEEMTAPKRIITSTVKITGGAHPVLAVKTSAPIPKEKIMEIMDILSDVAVTAPIKIGDVIVKNVAETGTNIIATQNS